jgi:hypothetical protein
MDILQNIMLIVLYIQTDINLYWKCNAVLQKNMQTAQLAENYFFSISCNTIIPELQEACQPCSFGRFKFSHSQIINCNPQVKIQMATAYHCDILTSHRLITPQQT